MAGISYIFTSPYPTLLKIEGSVGWWAIFYFWNQKEQKNTALLHNFLNYMSPGARKPIFRFSINAWLKPASSATETS